jgi:coenzyme F390 synthetase
MNVGANMMTLAASKVGFTIIPEGRSTFPLRVITSYKPTSLVGSVFKLLELAREMTKAGIVPRESSVKNLVIGGESFAEEARSYLSRVWDCKVYNTYGSTEGTMCGECTEINGLHVPEDLVHLDIYNPSSNDFVRDGECGRIILTNLIPVGGKCGTILLNYDTEDTTIIKSRDKCSCGRTHMRILTPQREAETFWVNSVPFNRIDIEQGIFQRENMDYLTGEYEAFLYRGTREGQTFLQLNMECLDKENPGKNHIQANFLTGFLKNKALLAEMLQDGSFEVVFSFLGRKELGIYRTKGRPRRILDKR